MNTQKEEIRGLVQTLYDCCQEGYDGTWDASTGEGREGFMAMQEGIVELARKLGIEIGPYKYSPEDNDD
ncbi:MAG: hypothetical protein ACE5GQ_12245 [Nitrospinales bacterium]